MYVDDVLSGAHDTSSAKLARDDFVRSLDSAGLALRKWTSNDPKILSRLPSEYLLYTIFFNLLKSNRIKTLGIRWNSKKDVFFNRETRSTIIIIILQIISKL